MEMFFLQIFHHSVQLGFYTLGHEFLEARALRDVVNVLFAEAMNVDDDTIVGVGVGVICCVMRITIVCNYDT